MTQGPRKYLVDDLRGEVRVLEDDLLDRDLKIEDLSGELAESIESSERALSQYNRCSARSGIAWIAVFGALVLLAFYLGFSLGYVVGESRAATAADCKEAAE